MKTRISVENKSTTPATQPSRPGRRASLAWACLWGSVTAAAWLAGPTSAHAQAKPAYPDKAVRIVVPYVPGGASDAVARLVAQKLSEAWGQSIVVENKPGAGGAIGAEHVARSAPDGYTLLLAAAGFMTASPSLVRNLPFDPTKDFQPLSLVVKGPLLLAVNPKVKPDNFAQFVELAAKEPGKVVLGNGGIGTAQHLGGEYLASKAGIKLNHVGYKGSAQATTDLLAGTTDAQLDNLVTLLPYLKSEKLRPLAVTSLTRVPLLPDVPTVAESGIKGFETGTWYGIVGPANMPAPIVDRIHAELVRIVGLPDVRQKLEQMGLTPNTNTPSQYAELIRADIAQNAAIIKNAGIQPQ